MRKITSELSSAGRRALRYGALLKLQAALADYREYVTGFRKRKQQRRQDAMK